MTNTDEILNEREGQYGDYWEQASFAQSLKSLMRTTPNYELLPYPMRESLEMECTKISRILHGDFNKADTWKDMSGYAELVVKELESE